MFCDTIALVITSNRKGVLIVEKTYKFVNHSEPISETEIRQLYDGYWVYIVKARFTETGGIIDGIPVIIGEMPYDGVYEGIYKQYKTDEYTERVGLSLLHDIGGISSLRIVG